MGRNTMGRNPWGDSPASIHASADSGNVSWRLRKALRRTPPMSIRQQASQCDARKCVPPSGRTSDANVPLAQGGSPEHQLSSRAGQAIDRFTANPSIGRSGFSISDDGRWRVAARQQFHALLLV
jgi:hypothetical protein